MSNVGAKRQGPPEQGPPDREPHTDHCSQNSEPHEDEEWDGSDRWAYLADAVADLRERVERHFETLRNPRG